MTRAEAIEAVFGYAAVIIQEWNGMVGPNPVEILRALGVTDDEMRQVEYYEGTNALDFWTEP